MARSRWHRLTGLPSLALAKIIPELKIAIHCSGRGRVKFAITGTISKSPPLVSFKNDGCVEQYKTVGKKSQRKQKTAAYQNSRLSCMAGKVHISNLNNNDARHSSLGIWYFCQRFDLLYAGLNIPDAILTFVSTSIHQKRSNIEKRLVQSVLRQLPDNADYF